MIRLRLIAGCCLLLSTSFAQAIDADELIRKNIDARGGMAAIKALKSVALTGKFRGGGGFEADYAERIGRPSLLRQEFSIQGMTQI